MYCGSNVFSNTFLWYTVHYTVQCGSDVFIIESETLTIQIKATEQYFPVTLLILMYKVGVAFESVDKSYIITI